MEGQSLDVAHQVLPHRHQMDTLIDLAFRQTMLLTCQETALKRLTSLTPVSYTHLDVYKRQMDN